MSIPRNGIPGNVLYEKWHSGKWFIPGNDIPGNRIPENRVESRVHIYKRHKSDTNARLYIH